MPVQDGSASETSPLLPKLPTDVRGDVVPSIEPSAGVAPEGTSADHVDGELQDGSALERQSTQEGRMKQYEGIPEVKSRMKYMFPALSVGVFLAAADQTLIVSSYGKIGTELDALNKTSWIATGSVLDPS